jgi:hypothetical protein
MGQIYDNWHLILEFTKTKSTYGEIFKSYYLQDIIGYTILIDTTGWKYSLSQIISGL